jgi:predicted nucleotidyltransferase component of viral defense system
MFYEVLDKPRLDLLPLFVKFKQRFYLAGGTALALQIGHRQSTDFDFFSEAEFNPQALFGELEEIFNPHTLTVVQQEANTLTIIVNGSIRVSFFNYPYPLLSAVSQDANLRLASVTDIGCMKLSAIVSRSVNKDYVDLYYIFKDVTLGSLLDSAEKKLPALDRNLILKSLVYFDDMLVEPLVFLPGKEVDIKVVQEYLVDEVKKLSAG